jgi:hypothetical protein
LPSVACHAALSSGCVPLKLPKTAAGSGKPSRARNACVAGAGRRPCREDPSSSMTTTSSALETSTACSADAKTSSAAQSAMARRQPLDLDNRVR